MQRFFMAVVLVVAVGCTETVLPGGQNWSMGRPMSDAYVLADASYQEEEANSEYSTIINEPVNTIAGNVAAVNGLNYLGFMSDEAAVTPVNAELGPVDDLSAFNTTVSVIDMFLWKSAVSIDDDDFNIVSIPVNEVVVR